MTIKYTDNNLVIRALDAIGYTLDDIVKVFEGGSALFLELIDDSTLCKQVYNGITMWVYNSKEYTPETFILD